MDIKFKVLMFLVDLYNVYLGLILKLLPKIILHPVVCYVMCYILWVPFYDCDFTQSGFRNKFWFMIYFHYNKFNLTSDPQMISGFKIRDLLNYKKVDIIINVNNVIRTIKIDDDVSTVGCIRVINTIEF